MSSTHEVTNQAPPPYGYDAAADPALLEALRREGAEWAEPELHGLGVLAGSEQAAEWGRLANENEPVLRTHDRFGHRVDEVEFHPHWHDLMKVAVEPRAARCTLAGAAARRTRRPCREVLRVEPGGGRPHLPGLHDLRGRPGPARHARARCSGPNRCWPPVSTTSGCANRAASAG